MSIPLHPDLAEALDTSPKSFGTFLQTNLGKKRSSNGLGNDMRKWCDIAKLPSCSSHGLRKACARRLAEAGASAPEIMSITGHKTLSEVQRYVADANRELMANSGMHKLMSRVNGEQTVVNFPDTLAKNNSNNMKIKDNN